jgi:hypothetical protein
MASVLARSMIEPMSSWTELMKQAEHCGLLLDADVEPDRRVEAIFWWTRRCVSSALKVARSSSLRDVVLRARAQPRSC